MTVTVDMALEALRERLDPESVEHSCSVAGMAALLAGVYGVDAEKAPDGFHGAAALVSWTDGNVEVRVAGVVPDHSSTKPSGVRVS